MKKKWVIFAAAVLFVAAAGLGVYLGTPSIPKKQKETAVPVQSVAVITGYAEKAAVRSRFLGVVREEEAVTVRLDEGRKTAAYSVSPGDRVDTGTVLAVYDNSGLLLEREQLLLDKEQLEFSAENAGIRIKTLKAERDQADAGQKDSYDLQIINAQSELDQTEFSLELKEQEIARLDEKLALSQVISPCAGIVTEIDEAEGSLSIVSEGTFELSFSVTESELEEFRAGDRLFVTNRDETLSYDGTVSRIESTKPENSETQTGAARPSSYPVYAVLEGANGLLPGQHVYVEKQEPTGQKLEIGEDVILLPEGYLMDVEGSAWVWLAGEQGTLEKRSVILGAYNDRHDAYEVIEGLSMTDYLAWPMASYEVGQKADFGE
ncbi:efflux RND transporter periplasmic adaptor subunit [Fusibacillus kribbianus]|uniref:Efflux RND transporter periplasmic adaptor subunit n=1 Tax=Fusibacillus kribbianus TaxID=3044208 RepID=A0AAP4BBD8_9FIRM|nr:hypothetical protein [Ruminococcus sp. YH-rum2234]MDI9242078.1 hypothetical protein [Ruminococcus sp. YH-rum2234]